MTWVLCRDEDHLALFIELLGRMPRRVWGTGKPATCLPLAEPVHSSVSAAAAALRCSSGVSAELT